LRAFGDGRLGDARDRVGKWWEAEAGLMYGSLFSGCWITAQSVVPWPLSLGMLPFCMIMAPVLSAWALLDEFRVDPGLFLKTHAIQWIAGV